jgi:hypothetical protein
MSAMGKPKVETQPVPNCPLPEDIASRSMRPFDFLPKQAPEKPLPMQVKMESTAKILSILLRKIRDESYSKKLPAATWNEVEKVFELKLQVLPLQTKYAAGSRDEIII